MNAQLPTFTSASWSVTKLVESLIDILRSDSKGDQFRLFTYAVTNAGWNAIADAVLQWKRKISERKVVCYAGTDHALTDPEALRAIREAGVSVRIMTTYQGIFHPKVFWLSGKTRHAVWVGSNNLTRDGLLHNIEFTTLIESTDENRDLKEWFDRVHAASEEMTESLLSTYDKERRVFADTRAKAGVGTFTWSKRKEPQRAGPTSPSTPNNQKRDANTVQPKVAQLGSTGDLVIEIMPLETGQDGKQVQLPLRAAVPFFGLQNQVGATRTLSLRPVGTANNRSLTITIFGNNTTRLSLNELDYRDRPCVAVFRRAGNLSFEFEIVQQSIFPDRYRALLSRCVNQTRIGSRRWGIV